MNNAQSFSQGSDQYAKNRPQYPRELFAYLSELSSGHEAAWDCATGNGQAAVSLAEHFAGVEATDISAEQIEHGILHPGVRYRVSPAEHTPFADESFDLITVATAVHWFEQGQFYREAGRVLKPGGVLAVWTYGLFEINAEIDEIVLHEFMPPIDPFWAEGNRLVMNGYRDLTLPFDEIGTPSFSMHAGWTLEQLSAYLRTWSAVKRYAVERGTDPVSAMESKLAPIWGGRDIVRAVKMPLFLRACRKPT